MIRQFGETLVVLACVVFGICVLMAAGVDWGNLPQHVEGFE